MYPSSSIHSMAVHPDKAIFLYNPMFTKDWFLNELKRVKGIMYPAYNLVPPYVGIVFHELGHVYADSIKVNKKTLKNKRKMIKNTKKYSRLMQKNIKNHFFLKKEIIADVWANQFIYDNLEDIRKTVYAVENSTTDEIVNLFK